MVSVQYLKHNITKHATSITVIFIIFSIYRGDFVAWWKEATISDWANYVLLVPAISLFLIYRKRRELKAVLALPRGGWFSSLISLSLCLQAFILYAYGSHTPSSLFFHMLSLAILTPGLIILIYGFRVFRSIMFPLLFLFSAAPPPIASLLNIASALTDATARLSILVVGAMAIPASLDKSAEAISVDSGSKTFILRLGFQCSGIYSLLGFIVFVAFLAYWLKGSLRRKLLLSALGVPLMFLINVLRVVIIIAVGYFINSGLALQVFHWLGGTVLIFIGTLVMLFMSEKILGLQIPQPTNIQTKSCSACLTWKSQRENFCLNCGRFLFKPRGVYRKRFVINMGFLALMCLLFLSITIPVFALGSHVVISLESPTKEQIESLMPQVEGWKLTYIYRDTDYEKIMSEDLVLLYSYTNLEKGPEGLIAWVFLEISSFQPHMVEGWTVCTPNMGWAVEKYNAFIISQKPPLVGWSIVLRNLRFSTAMSILCWHHNVYINTLDGPVHKMLGVSVFSYVNPFSESVGHERVFEVLSFLGRKIFDHWQYARLDQTIPAVIGLTVNQFLLNNPKVVIISMAAMAPLSIALSEMDKRKKWIRAKKIASYMSDRHRMLINSIIAIKAELKSVTLEALSNKYNEQRLGEETDPIELYKILIDLESRGVVERNHKVTDEKVAITWDTPLKVVYKP